MGIIATLIIGLIVGVIARFVYPGKQPMGWLWTIALGIGGAVVAGWGGQALGLYQADQAAGLIGSVVGALILLFIYNRVIAKK
mgnify:CR=1 FL=1|jgi:uncharacterized membrane protein YeaQ/YmgE (transglycosylase-associated protein family)